MYYRHCILVQGINGGVFRVVLCIPDAATLPRKPRIEVPSPDCPYVEPGSHLILVTNEVPALPMMRIRAHDHPIHVSQVRFSVMLAAPIPDHEPTQQQHEKQENGKAAERKAMVEILEGFGFHAARY